MKTFLDGFGYLLRGAKLLTQPKLRRYVVWPLLINISLFAGGIWLLLSQLTPYVDGWVSELPAWLLWLEGVIWIVLTLTAALTLFVLIALVAGVIAAPFNALLAEAIIRNYAPTPISAYSESESILRSIPHLIMEELRKLLYFAVRAIPLLLLFVIPLVNSVAPLLWFLFGAWMMALTYLAYPFEIAGVPFSAVRQTMQKYRGYGFGFGTAMLLATMIPGVNLLIMPAAVAGATLLYIEELNGQENRL